MSDFNLGDYLADFRNCVMSPGQILIRRLPDRALSSVIFTPDRSKEVSDQYIVLRAADDAIPGDWRRLQFLGIEPPAPIEVGDIVAGTGANMENSKYEFVEDGEKMTLHNVMSESVTVVWRIPKQHKESADAQSRKTEDPQSSQA